MEIDEKIKKARAHISEWKKIEHRLYEIRAYPSGWDGEDADTPNPEIVDSAIKWVKNLKDGRVSAVEVPDYPPARAAATSDGSLILEWQIDGDYIEAEFVSPDSIEIMRVPNGGEPEHYSITP